jgi:hypothetical protein
MERYMSSCMGEARHDSTTWSRSLCNTLFRRDFWDGAVWSG